MADIASRQTIAPRLPWRAMAVALVIIALLLGAAVIYVGTRQNRLPAPFGPAGNGLIAYSQDGDIYTVDPVTGVAKTVVTGPEVDVNPTFSPNGSRLAFARLHGSSGAYDLVVAGADGSGAHVITPQPIAGQGVAWVFTSDGSAVITSGAGGDIVRLATTGDVHSTVLANGRFVDGTVRATDGAILFENDTTPEIDLWVMAADGSNARQLWDPHLDGNYSDIQEYRWSPDGSMIAFTCSQPTTHAGSFICVMNADGSARRRVTDEADDWSETGLRWSPDSRQLAFDRSQKAPGTTTDLHRPIGIATVGPTPAPVRSIGPTSTTDTPLFDWSPDGMTLLTVPSWFLGSPVGAGPIAPTAIDVASGDVRPLPFLVTSNVTWQRTAT